MTEQELRDKLISVAPSAVYANESEIQAIVALAKAYADARVAQECKVLDEVVTLLHQTIANRNVEIAELKASLSQSQQMYTDLLVGTTDAITAKDTEIAELKAQIRNYELRIDSDAVELDKRYSERTELNAEIKRLRDGIQKGFEKLAEIPYCSVLRTIFDNANGVQNGLESLLSPAPVTEGPKKTFSLQMYECNRCEWYGQVGESIETESYDVCPKCLSEDLTLLDSPKNEDQE